MEEKQEQEIKEVKGVEWITGEKKFLGMPIPFSKEKKKPAKEVQKDSPMLLLIGENNKVKTITNIKSGKLLFDTKDGKDGEGAERAILIDEHKRLDWEYGGKNIGLYIAYENEATCLPHKVRRDSNSLYLFFQKIMLEANLLRDSERGGAIIEFLRKHLLIIMVIIGVIYFGWQYGLFDKLFAGAKDIIGSGAQVVSQTTSKTADAAGALVPNTG